MAFAALMGARVKRKEDPRLITGAGQYVGNLTLPGMRHAAFVRSPYAHANVRGIDASAALKRPGVFAVVTGDELRGAYQPMRMDGSGEALPVEDDKPPRQPRTHYPLSIGRVRFVGEAVAVVVADSPAIAADAVNDVLVDWAPLPVAATLEAALAPNAPRLFDEMPDNVERVWTRKRGQPDEAFANAERIVKLRLVNQRLAPVPLETRATLAAPDAYTRGLTVWTSTQAAHDIRSSLAKMLNLSENAVRVIAPDVGGGFGQKIGIYPEDVVLAALALRYGFPLRWVEARSEHLAASPHGRSQVAELEAAVQSDGTVTALKARLLGEVGAYPRGAGDIHSGTGSMIVGPYRIPSVDIEVKSVFTNTVPIFAYRGAGRPEATYHIERLMDAIAMELNLDPVAVRRRNFIPPDAFPYLTPAGGKYDSGEYDKALTKALDISHYAALREEQQRRLNDPNAPLLGIGLATYVEVCAFGYESAVVRAEPSGTVTAFTGISPHGQGQATTFAQIVSDQLGVDYDKVVVKYGDTANTPMGLGTMGSRGLVVGGSALIRAAGKVREKAVRIAAHILEAAAEDVELRDARYQVKGVPSKSLTFAQIAERAYTEDLPDDIDTGLEATDFFRLPNSTSPFGTHVAVVEIDRETGEVRVRDYFTVDDCGPRISPALVEGQIHGGLAQGIAQALLEEVRYDENGQPITASLLEYAVPFADRFPMFNVDSTVTPSPTNPLGVKGIGEAATIGSTPAVVNAVLDALRPLGVRHLDMPLKPEKIWRALRQSSTD
jgi:carbon-monoxide dehydrogenase large subunit